MPNEKERPEKLEIPPFNDKEKAQALAVVMMCVTQSGLVNDLFPHDGSKPNYEMFTKVGANKDFLDKFIANAKNTNVVPLFVHYCRALTTYFATIVQDYSPPYCPGGGNGAVFERIHKAVNQ